MGVTALCVVCFFFLLIMNKELVISAQTSDVQIALLEDKQLVELHQENASRQYSVGDIFVGKVHKVMQGLNAAFIDVSGDKDGFIHYLDLGPQYYSVQKYLKQAMNGDAKMATLQDFKPESILEKTGNLSGVLSVGQLVLVQVAKEPISTKGPKLTGDISIAGHYIVLVPFSNKVSISQKIKSSEERVRLRRLMQSIRPQGFGVIVRTNAEGRSVSDLDNDLHQLMTYWAQMTDRLKHVASPQRVHAELSATSALIRDLITNDFDTIYCDNEAICDEVRNYLQQIAPDKVDIVRSYKLQEPIFDQMGVSRDIRKAFGKIVTIRSGIYLYVEHTEAMHVIDVNSGNHVKMGTGQEDTALQVNIESAKEIARQLRLRDMGGIVIVDFVDMLKAENRKKLYDVMCEEMAKDKARHTILPLSKFGLMQITRQRVRPVVEVDVQEKCPFCDGTGTIKSSLVVVDEIESNVKYLQNTQNNQKLTILTHPYVEAYLNKGWVKSIRRQWSKKYHTKLEIKPMEKFSLLEYRFLDSTGEEISM